MSTPSLPRDPDELAQLRAELAAQRTEIAALNARVDGTPAPRPRRRLPRRFLPLALVALLVVLTPLATFAANPFTDLTGGVHDANIGLIYDAGITKGCVPDVSYCPTDNVTRQEMASFLARTAGLGTNPPVVNAKTAQTAALATNATNAVNATNATTVGGYAPNGLVRVARNGTTSYNPLTATTYVTLTQVTLTAPSAGFIQVTGAAVVVDEGGGGQRGLFLRSRIGASVSPESIAYPGTTAHTAANTWVFPVAAGPQTIILEGTSNLFTGAQAINVGDLQLTALFVPFGSGGAGTLGSDDPPTVAPSGTDPAGR